VTSDDTQRRFFDRRAARYDSRFLRARWPRNQEVKARVIGDALGPALDGVVLEIGCGTGQIAELVLASHATARYVGLDLSEGMLGVARERLARFGERVELRRVDDGLPLDDLRLDAAFGVDVLHHVADPPATLTRLHRALQPGAPVVFLEGNPRFPVTTVIGLVDREERGLFQMTFRTLRTWFADAGYSGVSVRYGPLYTPPGPPGLTRVLDAADATLARMPLLRSLALFYVVEATS
jgi:ubiquinone/menaquinone biosynthesis C-methylase UbiE